MTRKWTREILYAETRNMDPFLHHMHINNVMDNGIVAEIISAGLCSSSSEKVINARDTRFALRTHSIITHIIVIDRLL